MELHVIFGTGAVGTSVMQALVRRGKSVRMINRSGKPSTSTGAVLPANVEICAGDAYNPQDVARLTEGAVAVYQGAQPEYHEWQEKFPPLQASIIEGTAASGAKLIVIENLYPYGDPAGKPLTETTPYAPITRKGRIRLTMHQALMAAHRSSKVRVAVARASDYYGPGYMLTGEQIVLPAIRNKKASAVGSLDAPHTFTYTSDVGEAMAILGEYDQALGQVWHVPSAPVITQRDLITMLFREAGHTPKMSATTTLMMRFAGLFIPGAKEMVEMMYEFNQPFVMDSSKFTRTFGMTATPTAQAVYETIAWFRQNQKEA